MRNFLTGLGEDLNSKFTARFVIIILIAMLFFSITGKAQAPIVFHFDASSAELQDESEVVALYSNYRIDSIVGYANSLPNADGKDNCLLARARVESIVKVALDYGFDFGFHAHFEVVPGGRAEDRKVVVYVSYKYKEVSDMPMAQADTSDYDQVIRDFVGRLGNANEVLTATAEDEYFEQMERDMSRSTVMIKPVDVSQVNVSPSSHVSSLVSEVAVLDRQSPANLYTLNQADIAVRQTMEFGLDTATNHIDKSMICNKGMNESKKLRRRMRLMLQMWIKYDAIPSANELKEGAVFGNGNSYRIAATWTPTGVSAKRQAIEKYGDQIPWLGWDKKAYKEYWATHSVFEDKEQANPLAHKMSYKPSKVKKKKRESTRNGLRKRKWENCIRDIKYFFHSIGACRKTGRR
jgi:hypothetical protein